jgi:integrase
VLYAIWFLTGLRQGQAFELRWADYEADFGILGRLSSSRSWSSKKNLVTPTKTGVDHLIPVHPVLAKVLADWKLNGWRARHGRQPKPNDLIAPTISGEQRDVRKALEDFLEDLDRLGLRHRRQYDSRRTFMSLAMDGGASKELVKAITHPRPGDVFDLYVTPSWEALCRTVTTINVEMEGGENVIALRPEAASPGRILAVDAAPEAHKTETPQPSLVAGS